MSDISDHDKRLLQPYADALARTINEIEAMDSEDLAALTNACDAPTSTNCWWAMKQAADFLKPLIAAEYGRRTMLEVKRADDAFSGLKPTQGEDQ